MFFPLFPFLPSLFPFSPFFFLFFSFVSFYCDEISVYIEYKVRIWIEKSVFFFRFRFVKFEIFFKFGIYPFIHFIFFSLSTSRFIRNFIIYIFIIYILIINFIFLKLIKIVIIPNSIASCSLSLSLSRAIKNGQRGRNRGANFHFISMKRRGREGRIFFIVEIRKTKPIEIHVKSLPRRAHCNLRISPPFAHYIIQQVNCHASSNIHYEPVNGSLLHRLNFAQTFSNLAKQSAKLFATMRKHASIFFSFFFFSFFSFFRTITITPNERSLFAYNRQIIKSANFRVDKFARIDIEHVSE